LNVSFTGANAAEFSLVTAPVSPVLTGGQTTFTIRFSPIIAGTKAAQLRVTSNDIDETPFDIALSATVLLPGADEDSDGVTNEAEVNLASLGFDPYQSNAALKQLLHDNARGLGLYQASDMQSLALGNPLLQRNPATGNFTLKVEVLRSPDLLNWTLLPGTADLTFTPAPTGPEFYRVFQVVP